MAPKKGNTAVKPVISKVANWTKSCMTELMLEELVKLGSLPAKDQIEWRVPEEETRPQPGQNEIVIFADHLDRGFRPPGSKFFRDFLHYYDIRPQDLAPNSVLNLSNFQVFCEVYLQIEPTVSLFQEFFYCNRQTECKGGPSLECGGVTIQRRRNSAFPDMALASHPKGWQKTWFYCKDTSPNQQNPLPGYRYNRLESTKQFPSYASAEERLALEPIYSKINALIAHGLSAIDLTRCWMSWRIQPLSFRTRPLHEYTGELEDDLRFSNKDLSSSDLVKAIKKLLGETQEKIAIVGLAPFYAGNPAPEVSRLLLYF